MTTVDITALVQDFLAKGGQISKCADGVAEGVRMPKVLKETRVREAAQSRRKAEPITTGDTKFDMYLNALPAPVRQVVLDKQLDVRAVYKEYRVLKKDGLIEKYCTAQAA